MKTERHHPASSQRARDRTTRAMRRQEKKRVEADGKKARPDKRKKLKPPNKRRWFRGAKIKRAKDDSNPNAFSEPNGMKHSY